MKGLFLLVVSVIILGCSAKQETPESEWRHLYDLGMSSFYAKNFSEAIAYLYRASRKAPQEPKVWNALGITYMEVGEFKKSEEAFKRALQSDPNFSEAKMNLGILYLRKKDYREAIKYLREAVSDETFDKKHVAFYHLAKVYKELGDKRSYLENLKKATAYNPLFMEAQLELGSAYMDEKNYEEAHKLYRSLIDNNFGSPEVYLGLAKALYEMGMLEEAKEALRAVLENKQANNLHRSQAYELLSKILIKKQAEKLRERRAEKVKATKKVKETSFGVQIAAFSTRDRAERLVRELRDEGIENLRVVESSGVYKVVVGRFQSREEAQKELERLKELEIYGFIVEVE
ncbi:MAG TPA: tetratricopeptide repeat protein [Aquifex aeolicus]|nr:tetratricopeptide repeat protein [Aquifex aeolicus]